MNLGIIMLNILAIIGVFTLIIIALTLWAFYSDDPEIYEFPPISELSSNQKSQCENVEKCIDYSGMVMDSTAVDCYGCFAYVPDKLGSSIPTPQFCEKDGADNMTNTGKEKGQ